MSSVVHAVGDGVYAENTQGIFFEEEWPVYVMRLKGGLSPDEAETICDYVRSNVGTQYSLIEAARSPLGGDGEASAKQFCSRLVAQAYELSGHRLVASANFCTPNELLNSALLEQVQNCTEPVEDAEVDFWQSGNMSPVDHTMEPLNIVLKQIRKIDNGVQSFQDIGHFVMRHPEHDDAVNRLFQGSGYLSAWKQDFEEFPWRYSNEEIEKMPDVGRYVEATLKGDPRNSNRFTKSLAGLRSDYNRAPRKTLASLIELYERLVDQHAKRYDAAAFWQTKFAGR
jgi:hypothetical protein